MKEIKGTLFVLLALMALVGMTYVYAGSNTGGYNQGNAGITVVSGKTRDFERNIYVVETTQQERITYSVAQAKSMQADLNGMSPSRIIVNEGDTVKLAIDSGVNCDFRIGGYNVNARTRRDTTTEVQFNADLTGIYPYMCEGFLNQEIGFMEVIR